MCKVALNHDIECQLLDWMTFSELRQLLIQSKYIHQTPHKFFVRPNTTYPTLLIKKHNTTYLFDQPYFRYYNVWVILSKLYYFQYIYRLY